MSKSFSTATKSARSCGWSAPATNHVGRVEFYDSFRDRKDREAIVRQDFDGHLASKMLNGYGVVRTYRKAPRSGLPLAMEVLSSRFGDEVKTLIKVTNEGDTAFVLKDIRIHRRGSNLNYAGLTRVKGTVDTKEGTLAVIPPNDTVQAFVAVEEAMSLGKYATVSLLSASGSSRDEYIQLWPPPEREPPHPNENRLSIRAQAVGGIVQLDDGIGLDDEATTLSKGLGARVAYGVTKHLSIEGEFLFLTSGDVVFENVVWDGVEGDLMRTANLFRMQLGGGFQVGKQYAFHARAVSRTTDF